MDHELKRRYEQPTIRELGSLNDLTQQQYNKIGTATDIYSTLTNGAVIGSLVPAP